MSVITIVECSVIIFVFTHFLQSIGLGRFTSYLWKWILYTLIIELSVVDEPSLLFIIKMTQIGGFSRSLFKRNHRYKVLCRCGSVELGPSRNSRLLIIILSSFILFILFSLFLIVTPHVHVTPLVPMTFRNSLVDFLHNFFYLRSVRLLICKIYIYKHEASLETASSLDDVCDIVVVFLGYFD